MKALAKMPPVEVLRARIVRLGPCAPGSRVVSSATAPAEHTTRREQLPRS